MFAGKAIDLAAVVDGAASDYSNDRERDDVSNGRSADDARDDERASVDRRLGELVRVLK